MDVWCLSYYNTVSRDILVDVDVSDDAIVARIAVTRHRVARRRRTDVERAKG
jgi:hypothetical protein